MKNLILVCLIILLGSTNSFSQDCLPGGIWFTDQSEIDDFSSNYPGCTQILGNVVITNTSSSVDSVSDLSGLSQIISIDGSLEIRDIDSLTNLTGLANLASVDGDFIIDNNPQLTDISALSNISSLNGIFTIKDNVTLTNFAGLENLEYINDDFTIRGNYQLTDISALSNLSSLGGHLYITQNGGLQSLAGLENLTTVDENVWLFTNGLVDLSGLASLDTVKGSLSIQSEDIVDLTGLENLKSINGFYLGEMDSLQSIAQLTSLTDIGDHILFEDNAALTNLIGLENITKIGGDLNIKNNDALINFEGLNNLDSIGEYFNARGNALLESFSGLESLSSINGTLSIRDNPYLTSLSALGEFSIPQTSGISIYENPNLSICEHETICNILINGGNIEVYDNAPGCNTTSELMLGCATQLEHTSLVGQVIADIDLNCEQSAGDLELGDWLITVSSDLYSYGVTADSTGHFDLPVLAGDWTLNVESPSSFWSSCFSDSLIQATAMSDSIATDFFMQPAGDCSYIDFDVTMPLMRICQNNIFVVDYCNYGVELAEDVIFTVTLDTFMNFVEASIPYTVNAEGQYIFEIDSIDVFDCGQFSINTFLDCDSVMIWDLQCIHVDVIADDLCSPDNLWDESIVEVNGFCENDSIFFDLENIGTGDMSIPAQFRVEIIVDDIILFLEIDDYQLESTQMLRLAYEIGDTTTGLRLTADQTIGNPVVEEVSVVVPNCNDIVYNVIFTLLPSYNGNPFSQSYCAPAISSYDPNIKTALPVGMGDDYEIDKDWKIDYTIQFQNTGNDTAFLVVLKDVISDKLDLGTFEIGGSSHPFTWDLLPNRELVLTFENILLPDSTTNLEASQGFVSFSISPKESILPGEEIENTAGIYFDFNLPIITNTVLHTIRKPVVTSSEHINICEGLDYMGQAIWQDTMIQLLIEFVEYDSIHFIHLDVDTSSNSNGMAEVLIGEYFESILIEHDTNFVITYIAFNGCDSLVNYTISALTDLNESNNYLNEVDVFPNPTKDMIHIQNYQNDLDQKWTLFNYIGEKVWTKQLTRTESLSKISVANFPSGAYLLRVETERGEASWKILIL